MSVSVKRLTPLESDWKLIAMDDFDQFRTNLTSTRRFASLSSLPPLDMMYFDDTPVNMQKIGSKPELSMPLKDNIFNEKQNDSFANPPRALDARNVIDVTTIQDVTATTDLLYDLSSSSDISQVTTTGEVLMVHHCAKNQYDANDPVLISYSSSPFPSTPFSKPPLSQSAFSNKSS
jgi:hypothetical protein